MMIFTKAVFVYLTYVVSHITTAFGGFSMENSMAERKDACKGSLRQIKDVIRRDSNKHYNNREHFYIKSAQHDNQILTGKLNNLYSISIRQANIKLQQHTYNSA